MISRLMFPRRSCSSLWAITAMCQLSRNLVPGFNSWKLRSINPWKSDLISAANSCSVTSFFILVHSLYGLAVAPNHVGHYFPVEFIENVLRGALFGGTLLGSDRDPDEM